jgi:hypothetical protein
VSIQDKYEATVKGDLDYQYVEEYCIIFQINFLGDPALNNMNQLIMDKYN